MLSDIEIAKKAKKIDIRDIAASIDIGNDALYCYGNYMAKIDVSKIKSAKNGKLVLVSAINPTAAGEGKTTVSIGLADGMRKIGKQSMLALREPSMGPVFGMKGGAAGGGMSQVLPMEEINLHFTGDFHAITSANNLLAALIDNHIQKGNKLKIHRVVWRRCLDMNDRQLRFVIDGLRGQVNGVPREDSFDITPASEVMATLCLSNDMGDLRARLSKLVIGYTFECAPISAGQLGGVGAMLAILKQAIMPNLVQTIENTPALVHCGPFANIAHGCNSVIATKAALRLSDYAITEAGFGADLGAEKFIDIKCRYAGIQPDVVVLVATLRALKSAGGISKNDLANENISAVNKGLDNLYHHVDTIKNVYNITPIIALNKFDSDSDAELSFFAEKMNEKNIIFALADGFSKGGEGMTDLAKKVVDECDKSIRELRFAYDINESYSSKIEDICKRVYGADGVNIVPSAQKQLDEYEKHFPGLPVCMAKTQYSISDDPSKIGRPTSFSITVKEVRISAGAGFVVALTGDILAMPGLPSHPAAYDIDIDESGEIVNLF